MKSIRSMCVAFAGVAALGVTLGVSSEARADVGVEAHLDLDLTADPGGLFFVGKPTVKIEDPRRLTVTISDAPNVVHSRVVGMQFVEVEDRYRPIVYVGRHHHVRPIVYHVPRPVWVVKPQAVYVAPRPRRPYVEIIRERPRVLVVEPARRPVVVKHTYRPKVVVGRPGTVVVRPPSVVVRPPSVVVRPPPPAHRPPPRRR